MKNILIIANFCRDFSETDNGRFMYLCKELSKENQVEIVTSDFDHATKFKKEPLLHHWPFKITFLDEPGYKKNISLKRFYSHYKFGKSVADYLEKIEKPDIVYCAVPSLTAAQKAASYCRKKGVRFAIDIQDLWPEAFAMALNIPVLSPVLFYPFRIRANKIYKAADEICAVSETYATRALEVNKKNAKAHVAFLGTRLATFDENAETEPAVRKEFPEELWLGYCGTLSDSYDISCVLEALKILKDKKCKVPKFLVMGDGPRKQEFEKQAEHFGLDVLFTGKLEYVIMCATLKQCDMVINPIKKGSGASIINKHGDYASSGLPVINTQASPEYRKLIDSYRMGLNCEVENAADVAEKIEYLVFNENVRLEMGQNARRCAEEKFDRNMSYKELFKVFED